jgi:type VI secretion system secreted protein VgrG
MKSAKAAQFSSPLGEALVFYALNGRETLGQPFNYEVDLLSDDPNIDLTALLGKPVGVSLERYDGGVREFNGFVTRFALLGGLGRYARYRVVLRPWIWLLSHSQTSRIFHKQTVPAILKQIFRERGFTDFSEDELSTDYREWEYLVQYRESELNFLSRLMEQEGIYYYFKHEGGKHTLVLADGPTGHHVAPEYDEGINYFPPVERERRNQEHIDHWFTEKRLRTTSFTVGDYDFKRPAQFILAQSFVKHEYPNSQFEVYDYPAEVANREEAEREARIKLEQHMVEHDCVEGAGNPRGIAAGSLFTLQQFPREDQNKEYLVIDAAYEVHVGEYESTSEIEDKDPEYRMRFSAIDAKVPYRAPRVTRKPIVEGPQTAMVIAEGDQEIWTDEYGRVKVLFHWDIPAQDKSCWVRVAQVWAGTNFGAMHIPRAGQEVIVDFLEGDPDRPIITGRVYNADNMPPYPLPANQTQSGIRSRSTKGGGLDNFNELRFEDKKGEEELSMQAEKNMTTLVKNDQTTTVKANRSAGITGSDSVSVGGDRSVSVNGNLSVTVKGGGKSPFHSTLDVTGKHKVHTSDTIDMDAPNHITFTVAGSSITIEPGKITLSAGGGAQVVLDANVLAAGKGGGSMLIDPNILMKSDGGGSMLVDANILAKSSAGHSLLVDGGQAQLSVGGSSTQVTASAVSLDSAKIAGSGGGATIELTAAGASMAGSKVSIAGQAVTEVSGALVKIN